MPCLSRQHQKKNKENEERFHHAKAIAHQCLAPAECFSLSLTCSSPASSKKQPSPDISQRHIPHPARKHKNGSSEIAHHLPDRLFVSLAREVADEDRAVGVAGGLGVAEQVVCSERELEMNGETNDEAPRRNRTGREAHAQRGADEGAEDGVVVGRDVRAVDAAHLDRVVLVRVEHRVHAPAAHLAPAAAPRSPPASYRWWWRAGTARVDGLRGIFFYFDLFKIIVRSESV
jgi:hypothetical protein